MDDKYKIYIGDCLSQLKELEDCSINCCVTSPPYYALRDYGNDLQIGLEETPEQYINKLVEVFNEVKRVLKDDGTLWLNIGDTYANNSHSNHNFDYENGRGSNNNNIVKTNIFNGDIKQKDLIGIPWMLAFALRANGWYLRQDIIWHKPNPMPESVKDRCTKSHEYIFLLSKSPSYYFDMESIREVATYQENRPSGVERERIFNYNSKRNNNPEAYLIDDDKRYGTHKGIKFGGNKYSLEEMKNFRTYSGKEYVNTGFRQKRDVWSVAPSRYKGAHFATFPEELITPCILAGCPIDGVVLDPFSGSGTTGVACVHQDRKYIGIELNEEYAQMSIDRLKEETSKEKLW